MFYCLDCKGFYKCKGLVWFLNICFLMTGLAMMSIGVWLLKSFWHYLVPGEIIKMIIGTSVVQVVLCLMALRGVYVVDDHHEARSRNYFLFLYSVLTVVAFSIQFFLFSETEYSQHVLSDCGRPYSDCSSQFNVSGLIGCCPDTWINFQQDHYCCGFDPLDTYARDPFLNSTCSSSFPPPSDASLPEYVGFGGSLIRGCREFLVARILYCVTILNATVSTIACLQVISALAAFGLSTCRFKNHTRLGFRADGSVYGVLGDHFTDEDQGDHV